METSRKLILSALILSFIAQFFAFVPGGHTTMTLDLGRHLVSGGLPYGSQNGWSLHKFWFFGPLYFLLVYLFYKSWRRMYLYGLTLFMLFLMFFGEGFGALLALSAFLVACYATYRRWRESRQPPTQTDPVPTQSP